MSPRFLAKFTRAPNFEDLLKMASEALTAPDDKASKDADVPLQPTIDVDDRAAVPAADTPSAPGQAAVEVGGRNGPDPTRYGDWELRGRCIDF